MIIIIMIDMKVNIENPVQEQDQEKGIIHQEEKGNKIEDILQIEKMIQKDKIKKKIQIKMKI